MKSSRVVIHVSIPKALLQKIDALRRKEGQTRVAFIRSVLARRVSA